jgi:hypothetical protein
MDAHVSSIKKRQLNIHFIEYNAAKPETDFKELIFQENYEKKLLIYNDHFDKYKDQNNMTKNADTHNSFLRQYRKDNSLPYTNAIHPITGDYIHVNALGIPIGPGRSGERIYYNPINFSEPHQMDYNSCKGLVEASIINIFNFIGFNNITDVYLYNSTEQVIGIYLDTFASNPWSQQNIQGIESKFYSMLNELKHYYDLQISLNDLVVDNTNIVPYIEISPKYGISHITSLDILLNLINQRKGYLTDDVTVLRYRMEKLKKHTENTKKAIETFNYEKNLQRTIYEKIKSLFSDFKNYYINNLTVEPLTGESYRKNMGKTTIDMIPYLYKRENTFRRDAFFHNLSEILELYEFIINCNNAYFNENYQKYSVEFVKIPKILIYTKEEFGYVMNIVAGSTVRDLKKNDNAYWIENENLIKEAMYRLIDKLTEKKVLVVDFAYDNIMWDKRTNKLTYIDIMSNAFNRDDELYLNNDIKMNIEIDFNIY